MISMGWSCTKSKKDQPSPTIGTAYPKGKPSISLLALTNEKIRKWSGYNLPDHFVDSISISIRFIDGDGDIGRDTGDYNYICLPLWKFEGAFRPFRADSLNVVYKWRMGSAYLNKQTEMVNFSPTTRNLQLLSESQDSSQVTIKFLIHIKDNAGHESDTLETPETVLRFY